MYISCSLCRIKFSNFSPLLQNPWISCSIHPPGPLSTGCTVFGVLRDQICLPWHYGALFWSLKYLCSYHIISYLIIIQSELSFSASDSTWINLHLVLRLQHERSSEPFSVSSSSPKRRRASECRSWRRASSIFSKRSSTSWGHDSMTIPYWWAMKIWEVFCWAGAGPCNTT